VLNQPAGAQQAFAQTRTLAYVHSSSKACFTTVIYYFYLLLLFSTQVHRIRHFISTVGVKQGLQSHTLTGNQLADLVEHLVPSLNDMQSTAKVHTLAA